MRVNRSAKTGKIVSEKFAEANPDTTFTQEIDMKKDTKTPTEQANEKAVELDKTAEATNEPAHDGSFDKTPTAPQIQTTAPVNITSSPKGVDTKSVKFESQSGDPGAPKTTIVEEVTIVEGALADVKDRDELIRTLAVRAQTQGINQAVDLGAEGVLTVYQDGTHSIDKVPDFEKDPK